MHIEPAWTRDGMNLLLVSNRGVPLGSGHVWKVPLEADAMTKAKPVLKEQSLFRTRPDVSIDGKRFIYSSNAAPRQYDNLYVLPVAGGEAYKMTSSSYDDFHPRWSPDGEWIAYISNEGGLPQLGLLETYGGAARTSTSAAALEASGGNACRFALSMRRPSRRRQHEFTAGLRRKALRAAGRVFPYRARVAR